MKNSNRNGRYVEIMDTTLRDGEQTPGVAFTPAEKLGIVRLLINHLHLDRLEIGSARVSDDSVGCSPPVSSVHGIFQARILEWVAISSSGGSS